MAKMHQFEGVINYVPVACVQIQTNQQERWEEPCTKPSFPVKDFN